MNRKRVARVMRERDIQGVIRRKRRSLTQPGKTARPAADLLGRDFDADRPGTKLVGDITALPTGEVVGYSMADHHRATLVVDALKMADGRGRLQPGWIAHSDRGSEYTSSQFRHEIRKLDLRQSFWALLKEEIGTRVRPGRATARAEVFDFIETFYNRRRLRRHKVFGYLTPAETRQRHQRGLAA